MANTQTPQAGRLEQILRTLQMLATSGAYSAELTNLIQNTATGPSLGPFVDIAASTYSFNISDTQYGGPGGWVGQEAGVPPALRPGFAVVQITDNLRILDPMPNLQLIGRPGRKVAAESGGVWEGPGFRSWWYSIDAVVITHQDDPQACQREALMLVDAFEHLVERNEFLGGLVELITAAGPPTPGGARLGAGVGMLAAASVRFEAMSRRIATGQD